MMLRSIRFTLLCLASAGNCATAATTYSNRLYSYSVSIPARYVVEYDRPPLPTHGFGVLFGAGRQLSVFAD
jgi:hypothetical protein